MVVSGSQVGATPGASPVPVRAVGLVDGWRRYSSLVRRPKVGDMTDGDRPPASNAPDSSGYSNPLISSEPPFPHVPGPYEEQLLSNASQLPSYEEPYPATGGQLPPYEPRDAPIMAGFFPIAEAIATRSAAKSEI